MARVGGERGRSDRRVALLLADLDRFKVVNDALGHAAGDRLLVEVASRFHEAFADADVEVFRFGGDEFVVTALVRDQGHAEELAALLTSALDDPIELTPTQSAVMTASVGIALTAAHDVDTGLLLSDADAAMYVAKAIRRGKSVFARTDQRPIVSHRFALEVSLAQALQERQIVPWYQPIVDLRTGRWSAVEALARWDHPERGPLDPLSFLPAIAEMGLLRQLTDCVLGQAAELLADPRMSELDLFLNLTAVDIDTGLPGRLADHVEDPTRLVVELTERDAMTQASDVSGVIDSLRSIGFRVALDDFGTGYSSLAMLTELALDIVKIDRTLIAGIAQARSAEVLDATIALGGALGLTMLAEGVEEQSELDRLRPSGVTYAQGYAVARPMPRAALLRSLS